MFGIEFYEIAFALVVAVITAVSYYKIIEKEYDIFKKGKASKASYIGNNASMDGFASNTELVSRIKVN